MSRAYEFVYNLRTSNGPVPRHKWSSLFYCAMLLVQSVVLLRQYRLSVCLLHWVTVTVNVQQYAFIAVIQFESGVKALIYSKYW